MDEENRRYKRRKMIGRCSIWVEIRTRRNIKKIDEFFQKDYETHKKKRRFNFKHISKATDIEARSIRTAIYIMCFEEEAKYLMYANRIFTSSGGVSVEMKVKRR